MVLTIFDFWSANEYRTWNSNIEWNLHILGGHASGGEALYIGRKTHAGVMVPGKIHPSHDGLYIAYGGKEHFYKTDYEILVAMH